MEFSIQPVVDGQTTTLYVAGEVDLATAGELRQAAFIALDAGATELIIDLYKVTFLDSTGLAVLVALNNQTTDTGAHLTVRGSSPRVLKVMRITGLDKVLPLEANPNPGDPPQ
ncbi:MAG TPA: STAS domain-containing protein [Mycobacteriales bacterium]|nr:STAS domain-containing protein [Mycobacteriales bacterium]